MVENQVTGKFTHYSNNEDASILPIIVYQIKTFLLLVKVLQYVDTLSLVITTKLLAKKMS